MINQAKLKELLDYAPETGVFTWLIAPRRGMHPGDEAGCWSRDAGWVIRVDKRLYLAARLAWLYMTGSWPKAQIDHINILPWDNRWANLREATSSQNNANKLKQSNNSTGFKGVHFHSQSGRYRARLKAHGKHISLGLYTTPEEAHVAYRDAAKRIWGEFARY